MQEHDEMNEQENRLGSNAGGANRWLVIALVVLLGIAGVALGYGYRQQMLAGHLTAQQSVADATISQMQGQLSAVTSKLNDMTAAQQAQAQAQAQADAAKQANNKTAAGVARTGAKRATVTDKRYKQLQSQLAEQQKELKDTQDQVAKNRADLEGNISSTRDELNGSIARTHEELVVLQKRGERNYTEFDLMKAKQFQRIGPITLSLRKADTKHKNYDIEMIVDDNQMSKKRVNLYEPIWIHTENESQPVQIVVNRIEKNLIHGYVSAPKYRPSELATSGTAGALTPVAAHVQANGSDSQTQPSTTPPQQ
jgi:DNA repair exonuclease SbcCD ATPase subunit